MHLDDGEIQRLADAELAPALAPAVRAHVDACAECGARVAAARQEDAWMQARLGALDHPAPRVPAEAIVRDAGRGTPGWGRWAAGILLVLSASGIAYAAPGSPLPAFVQRAVAFLRGSSRDTTTPPAAPETGSTAGTAMQPGEHLRIVFRADQPGGIAVVALTETAFAQVRAVDGIAGFAVDPDRISVDNEGSTARFEIDIPLNAPRVDILVGDRLILSKDGPRIVTDARRAADGTYRVALSRLPR